MQPNPLVIMNMLTSGPLAGRVERASLVAPWIWDLGNGSHQLVYAMVFEARSDKGGA